MSQATGIKAETESPGFEDGFEDDVSLSPSSPRPVKDEDGLEDDEDDDRYEDALDLDTSQAKAKVWMVRMPKFLLDQFQNAEMRGEELGKVRIYKRQGPAASQPQKVRMVLNDSPEFSNLPHSYDLRLVNQSVDNVYVLKEQDLPKHRKVRDTRAAGAVKSESSANASNGGGAPAAAANSGAAAAAPQVTKDQYGNSAETAAAIAAAYDTYQPVVRAAPKKTALIGQALHEVNVTPDFKDKNYGNVLQLRREMEAPRPENQVTLLNDTAGVGGAKYGATLRSQRSMWANPQKKKDANKINDGKAMRIPENELLDKLFKLFEEYEHWTLRGLRERTRQPELYLKQVLDRVAVLNKKGPYAMKYGLRSEFKQMKSSGASLQTFIDAVAPPGGDSGALMVEDEAMDLMDGGDGDGTGNDNGNVDDEDDDDDEMETIL